MFANWKASEGKNVEGREKKALKLAASTPRINQRKMKISRHPSMENIWKISTAT